MFKDTDKFVDDINVNTWLDIVWSLVVLQKADDNHLASVLSPKFVSKLSDKKGYLNFLFFFFSCAYSILITVTVF